MYGSNRQIVLFLGILILIIDPGYTQHKEEKLFEPSPQDGFFNNLNHPDWGAVDDILIRKSPPAYQDGVYEPAGQDRPNPFTISDIAHSGDSGQGSVRKRTAMLVYFGQQVVEEILDVQRPGCPREFFNIPVPKDHRFNPNKLDNLQMPLQRSRFNQRTGQTAGNPRQQLNEITPFIDGTLFYGPGKAWTDAIREFKHGYLKVRDPSTYDDIKNQFPADNDIRLPFANPPPPADHYLKPVNRFFRLGNPRGFENPFLLTFGVIFFRWHNAIALSLRSQYGDDDERLFEEARRRVIAHHQKIVMYDWLPRWLEIKNETAFFEIPKYIRDPDEECKGKLCTFNGYDSEIHPGISQEFQTAAMRFGHTLVTPGLWLRGPKNGNDCNWLNNTLGMPNQPHGYRPIRLCNAYWNSREPVDAGMDNIIRGMSSTLAEKEDNVVVPDLREHLFGPLEFSRRDLVAINIQRAREHGLADYNSIRKAFDLAPLSWEDVTSNLSTGAKRDLINIYQNDTTKLDLFVGGLLETTASGPGPLFQRILLDQFLRIRHGDRFWFENKGNGYNFTDEEIDEIHKVTLRSIIINVTNVKKTEIQEDVFIHKDGDVCEQPCQLNSGQNVHCQVNNINVIVLSENCTSLKHYDYFTGSGAAYVLTFLGLGLCVPGTVGIMICMAKYRAKKMQRGRQRRSPHRPNDDPNVFAAVEWVGPNSDERNVKVKLDRNRKKIHIEDMRRKPLRMLDLRSVKQKVHYRLSSDGLQNIIAIRVQGDIDLVIKFLDMEEREKFKKNMDNFLVDLQIEREIHNFTEKSIYENAQTKEERQKYLDKFFRVICLQAFKREPGQLQIENISGDDLNKIIKIKLTRTEFADALGLKPNSIFVRNMFMMVDKNNSGFVEFQEFLDMFVVLASGDAEDKARMIFNMYDVRRQGKLTSKEFARMIHSMLDLSDSSISTTDMQALMNTMYKTAGLPQNADIDFEAFAKIFASDEYESTLKKATLGIEALGSDGKKGGQSVMAKKRTTFLESYNGLQRKNTRIRVKAKSTELPPSPAGQKLYEFTRIIENYRLQIFWLSLYILVTIGIFLERAFYYSFEREHAGLRRIAGYGVTVTRGAASVMMFTYASLLVTMSRNTITFLRETFLHRFIPFDSAHAMHKIIAMIALLFTVVHCVGHGINLYHISTQASTDLNCIFREYFRATDVLASFQYWTFGTITGFSGIILTLIVIVMYVFATPYARRNLFNAFWITHSFYILLYIFMVMHGTGRLVQPPLFQNYFYGPLFIFIVDKFISLSRNQVEIDVISAELLPSDVTALKFKRPINFEYKSGQWVRIACAALGSSEYHPFTLTSAPHEDYLSLHIRAVGPWTTNLRKTYDANNVDSENWTPPKVLVDGPFGEGHQDWYKFPVAVLVGGGIGVTPFASILKDIVHKTTQPIRFPCQKVYFLWVTRTQKQFEWLTDIIREVEERDVKDLVSVHIFITQFQQKFDLRTTMLYICERHFQKIAGKSLFTGLKAVTHFGRPQFQEFLESLHFEHPEAKQIGVFSCGPPPMTLNVDKACAEANKNEGYPTYSHHFENF